MRQHPMDEGPTDAELREIEREWPALEAELALVDEEIRVLTVEGGPTLLDWRRLRRAEHRALMARHLVYGTPAPAALVEDEVA